MFSLKMKKNQGVVATLFWNLLVNALVATQVVEDGTMSSLIVRYSFAFHFVVVY